MKTTLLFLLFATLSYLNSFAQDENLQVGGSINKVQNSQGAFYDYSDPAAVNIKIDIWGFVRFPGKFIIPSYSTISDLLSYAGGPTDAAHLQDMKILRNFPDSSQKIIRLNYKDFLFDDAFNEISTPVKIQAGDVVIVPGAPRFYFKDYLSTTLSIVSVLISIFILVKK